MSEQAESFRTYQMLFIGIIIASFTHELKNHLAIIKESAGLQQDIIAMDKKIKDLGALKHFLSSVDGQVDKSLKLISFLNRFAHRMDTETAQLQLHEPLDELIALTTRLANQKIISLEQDFNRDLGPLVLSPAKLQMLVFFLLDEKMVALDKKSIITLRTTKVRDMHAIEIVPQGQESASGNGGGRCPREVLFTFAREMGIEIEIGSADAVTRLIFTESA
ncbi:MAG TPA: hypothetical protein VK445_10420 [Dissulfurispiraceae bacterium]|nr:hypothetical protein [Dissulfurispiraceae bacterium]